MAEEVVVNGGGDVRVRTDGGPADVTVNGNGAVTIRAEDSSVQVTAPAGPEGPQGPEGPVGPQGPQGVQIPVYTDLSQFPQDGSVLLAFFEPPAGVYQFTDTAGIGFERVLLWYVGQNATVTPTFQLVGNTGSDSLAGWAYTGFQSAAP